MNDEVQTSRKHEGTYVVVQALLAVNPVRPEWSDVQKFAITGWRSFDDTPHRIKGYKYGRFWNDVMAWDDEREARKQFAELMKVEQKYELRLVWVEVSFREVPLVL